MNISDVAMGPPLAPTTQPPTVVVAITRADPDLVLQTAWRRARRASARLVVCAVVEDGATLAAEFEAVAQRTRTALPPDTTISVDVRIGDRATEVVACAELHNTELVVVGRPVDREGVLERFVNPLLPTALVRGARCAVLVVGAATASNRMVVATDLEDPTWTVLRAAGRELAFRGGGVWTVHAVASTPPMGSVDIVAMGPDPTFATITTSRDTLERALAEVGLPVMALRVEVGAPAALTLAAARELGADLIVIGTHGRAGASRLLLGSVAEEILRDATCDVLVVRGPRAA